MEKTRQNKAIFGSVDNNTLFDFETNDQQLVITKRKECGLVNDSLLVCLVEK